MELQRLEDRLVSLRATMASLLALSSGSVANLLTVIEPAVASIDAISPNRVQNTLLAVFLALFVLAGVIFLVEHLADGVRDSEAVREVSGLSTLGTIARMKGNKSGSEMYQLAALLYPRSGVAEAYRALRTNIEFSSLDLPIRTLLVTSSMPGEGKTVTAANLAVVFAQTGKRVLLVDADLRKPGVHLIFDLANAHGLTTMLRSDDTSLDALAQATEQDNLRVLTTGPLPPNPAELSGSQRMRTVIERLAVDQDLVILDSPPLQAVTDAAILGSIADGTLLVIDAQHSQQRRIRQAIEFAARDGHQRDRCGPQPQLGQVAGPGRRRLWRVLRSRGSGSDESGRRPISDDRPFRVGGRHLSSGRSRHPTHPRSGRDVPVTRVRGLVSRLHGDFLMGSRLSRYGELLESALRADYRILPVGGFWQLILGGAVDPSSRYLVLRHDIDTDPRTASQMWAIDRQIGVASSYFFRLSTLAPDLMTDIGARGSEASYHYEELATVAKRYGLRTPADAMSHLPQARNEFARNIADLRALTGLPMRVVAAHGDFVNRRLGIPNSIVLEDASFRQEVGVDLETYDVEILDKLPSRHTDAQQPRFWEPSDPITAIRDGSPVISILVHPRHWHVDRVGNARDDIRRLVEGLRFEASGRGRSRGVDPR